MPRPDHLQQLDGIAALVRDYTGLHVEAGMLSVPVRLSDKARIKCYTPHEHPGGERTLLATFTLRMNFAHCRYDLLVQYTGSQDLFSLVQQAMSIYYDELEAAEVTE